MEKDAKRQEKEMTKEEAAIQQKAERQEAPVYGENIKNFQSFIWVLWIVTQKKVNKAINCLNVQELRRL